MNAEIKAVKGTQALYLKSKLTNISKLEAIINRYK